MNNVGPFKANDLVLHEKHGQGTVLLNEDDTTVVRFAHGIEQVYTSALSAVTSVAEAITQNMLAPSLHVISRVQADIITGLNNAWGVFTKSRISLLPHQLWVCHRAQRNWPMRLLIADDVGMGKTIEAGLILWPLFASRKVQRLLILCPAKLVEQWQVRLKKMFDIRAATYHSDLDSSRTDFWGIHNSVIASLPTLRNDNNGRHERIFDAPAWDMVIIDEAHHLNVNEGTGKTLGYQLIEKLNNAGKITSCILFTATPHRGKNYGFWSLMSLLDHQKFGPKKNEPQMLEALPNYLIRNSKQKATDMKGKRLFTPVIQYPETFTYSSAEEAFYKLMSEFIVSGKAYATSLSQMERGQVILVLIALQKLASSSISAVASALKTRLNRLGEEAKKSKAELEEFDIIEEDDEDDESQQILRDFFRDKKQAHLQLMENEGKHLQELIQAADLVTEETRVNRIIEVIKQRFPNEPVLLFTEYKKTQALVISALLAEFGEGSAGFMNGDNRLEGIQLPDGTITYMAGHREDTCEAFNAGRIRFLVSTEAGGEGIDLQERCSALIHVDLPWNPMRLHQRVGRLNRYGQKKTVQVVSLRNPKTIEAMIWEKLEQKISSIMRALGSAMDEPEDLMQLVLGMNDKNFYSELFSEASSVKREKLDAWFDSATGTLGGEAALDTVSKLFGEAASFDLSDLKEVPPVDLADLAPFFQNMLTLNRRRPKIEGLAFSFKTPEEWLTTYTIRRSYENLYFDRNAPVNSDLVGVGHPILEKALHQAERLTGTVCQVKNLDSPVLVLRLASKLTDVSIQSQKMIVAVSGKTDELKLLREWELLKILNQCNPSSEFKSQENVGNFSSSWYQAAIESLNTLLEQSNLQLNSKDVQVIALILPEE